MQTVNASGQIAGDLFYTPFGEPMGETSNQIDHNQPFGFSTKRGDFASGLLDFGYRFYVPHMERWLNRDPIGINGGLNIYGYVGGSPVMRIDPLGLYWGEEYVDYVVDAIRGTGDFIDNYGDMIDANTIGGDKYFHCKANCEATQRGEGGEDAAQCISDSREWFDQNVKGDPASASAADQIANQHGRIQGAKNPNGDCRQICAPFRPNGLPLQY